MTDEELEPLDALDVDDLYADLALAEAGSEPNLAMAFATLTSVRAVMSAENLAAGNRIRWLVRKGKEIFNRYWPAVKPTVCGLYKAQGDDWVTAAATAIAALLNIGAAAAVLIIKIAIKLGLDAICDEGASPQPA